jgi:uncharacterized protein DUF2628
MPTYTVHAPSSGADLRALDKFEFVRDGFHLWAFVFGPVWFAWHRLWLATLGWVILMIAVEIALLRLGAGRATVALADLVIALLIGFEAATVRRWTSSRHRYRQLDIVVADNEEEAERRFFERWIVRQGEVNTDSSVDRGGPPPIRRAPNQAQLPESGVIGLFPEPGAPR